MTDLGFGIPSPMFFRVQPRFNKVKGSTPEDRFLHQAKDIIVAPGEPILYSQRLLFCFLWACDVMRSRTGGVCHGAAAKTRGLEQRPMTESPRSTDLLSPQKLFDLIIRSIRLIRTNPCWKKTVLVGTALQAEGWRDYLISEGVAPGYAG